MRTRARRRVGIACAVAIGWLVAGPVLAHNCSSPGDCQSAPSNISRITWLILVLGGLGLGRGFGPSPGGNRPPVEPEPEPIPPPPTLPELERALYGGGGETVSEEPEGEERQPEEREPRAEEEPRPAWEDREGLGEPDPEPQVREEPEPDRAPEDDDTPPLPFDDIPPPPDDTEGLPLPHEGGLRDRPWQPGESPDADTGGDDIDAPDDDRERER